MKFIGIVGTNDKNSYNRRLLKYMSKKFAQEAEIEVCDIDDIPLFNESDDQTECVSIQTLANKIIEADGVIFSCPEHNHSVTAILKSVIEWFSYKIHPLEGKPVMIVGGSSGAQGSSRAQLHLKQILDSPGVNCIVMPGNEFLLGHIQQAFDEYDNLKDPKTDAFLSICFRKFLRFTNIVSQLSEPEPVKFKPGIYEVSAVGHNGLLPMKVTLSDDKIENIDIDTSGETEGIATVVFSKIPDSIVKGQTLNVDAVSGASVTSQGIIDGVSEAIIEAGSDPEILKRKPKYKPKFVGEKHVEKSTDIVVVGTGGAGLSAAVSALDKGVKVIVLEKFPVIGGNTTRTGGQINAADPKWQHHFRKFAGEVPTLEKIYHTDEREIPEEYLGVFQSLKIEIKAYFENINDRGEDYLFDSPNLHIMQTYFGGKRNDLNGKVTYGNFNLVNYLGQNALETIEWLREKGVDFDEENVTEPVGAGWRRAREPKESEGYGYIKPLLKYVESHGGEIITECEAKELLVEDGRVIGLKATKGEQDLTIYATKGVIMATGGFAANYEMVKEYDNYWGDLPEFIPTTNSPALTGDGIKMGKAIGADLVDMGFVQLMPSADPITGKIFSGIDCPPSDFVFVNKQGKRFVNEYASRDVLARSLFEQGGVIYNISDSQIAKTRFCSTDEQLENDIKNKACYKADTLEELAKQINIDPEIFKDTIEKYNSYVDTGVDPECHKTSFNYKVEIPPFYATPRSPATHHTMGGLKIDEETHVLRPDNSIIDGLFAAGEVAGGIHAGNRLGGNALADIFTFGRLAGEIASSERG